MRLTFLSLFITVLQTISMQSQNFQQFINYLNALPEGERQTKVDSFMNAGNSFPYTEMDTLVGFVFQGNAASVAIAGDPTQWSPSVSLSRIEGTDFWHCSKVYETDARLDYKFVLNNSNWILDPLNPHTCVGGYGPNSELRMPGYILPPEIAYDPSIPHGIVKDTIFSSYNLGNSRPVRIYLPPGYDSTTVPYPVILFHDGPEYISLGNAANIIDYLIARKQIIPVVGIFVPPVDRTSEYAGSKKEPFRKFILDELMPVLGERYRLDPDPGKRAMIGASHGGNISLYIAMKNPESFGKIGAQSSNVQSEISNTFQSNEKLPLELYLDLGKYDIAALIPLVENLVNILDEKGYSYQYLFVPEGHSWGNWKGHLRYALTQFFPFQTGISIEQGSLDIELKQNYPNPFYQQTIIPFKAPSGYYARLELQDLSGRHLETLFNDYLADPENSWTFVNSSYPAGSYLYTLYVQGQSRSRLLTIIQ